MDNGGNITEANNMSTFAYYVIIDNHATFGPAVVVTIAPPADLANLVDEFGADRSRAERCAAKLGRYKGLPVLRYC